jgi:hypothetical protein
MYLGVTLDRTLSFKTYLQNTKATVNTRNNILRKLVNSRWGADPSTIRATALTSLTWKTQLRVEQRRCKSLMKAWSWTWLNRPHQL